tara:strand:- start:844 stop:1692 length:849 start_codon:yes stop_codon:yes gene_type:complete
MNLKTFYKIFFKHRIDKASFFLKFYILVLVPFKYVYNFFFFEKKVNLDLYKKKFPDLNKANLNLLFEHFNSDKGEYFVNQYVQPSKKSKNKIKAHGYAEIYEKEFKNFKVNNINILEIGSFYGNAAAALFFYFSKANIYSGDIYPDIFKYKSDRNKNFYVDSSSRESLKKNILNKKLNFDIIIEDASHMLKDQILSLFILFPLVSSGGLFIIEELDFPETRDDMKVNQTKPDLKEILKNTMNNINFKSIYINNEEKKYFLENFSSIEIKKGNFNEIAIIKKK